MRRLRGAALAAAVALGAVCAAPAGAAETMVRDTKRVVVVEENGTETLLDPGESVTGNGRFILGEVGMHVIAERDS